MPFIRHAIHAPAPDDVLAAVNGPQMAIPVFEFTFKAMPIFGIGAEATIDGSAIGATIDFSGQHFASSLA